MMLIVPNEGTSQELLEALQIERYLAKDHISPQDSSLGVQPCPSMCLQNHTLKDWKKGCQSRAVL